MDTERTRREMVSQGTVTGVYLSFFASADQARAGTCPFLISSCLWKDLLRSWQRGGLGIHSD